MTNTVQRCTGRSADPRVAAEFFGRQCRCFGVVTLHPLPCCLDGITLGCVRVWRGRRLTPLWRRRRRRRGLPWRRCHFLPASRVVRCGLSLALWERVQACEAFHRAIKVCHGRRSRLHAPANDHMHVRVDVDTAFSGAGSTFPVLPSYQGLQAGPVPPHSPSIVRGVTTMRSVTDADGCSCLASDQHEEGFMTVRERVQSVSTVDPARLHGMCRFMP
jgi:hypothetical protein